MRIVADENIACAEELFSPLGEVALLHGREISRSSLNGADALIVRSVTDVNRELLEGTPVRFVGTATIGTDHIDKDYLKEKGIVFADAKGCNADAVVEYILTAVYGFLHKTGKEPGGLKIGIVGCGNIGGRLSRILPSAGFTVKRCDPPLQRAGGSGFTDFDEIPGCDIVTFHTPLNKGGIDNTVHLMNDEKLNRSESIKLLLNASRGAVVENAALPKAIGMDYVLDVWENEPVLMPDVLNGALFATPHIAGYTLEGKLNGSVMMYTALVNFMKSSGVTAEGGIRTDFKSLYPGVDNSVISLPEGMSETEALNHIFTRIYDIAADTAILKKSLMLPVDERGKYFDTLRRDYKLRREFFNYTIDAPDYPARFLALLKTYRFNPA